MLGSPTKNRWHSAVAAQGVSHSLRVGSHNLFRGVTPDTR